MDNLKIKFPSPEEIAQSIEEGHKNLLLFLEDRRRSCLSRWYPLVKDIVPTPKTEIMQTDVELEQLWDCKTPEGFDAFIKKLRAVVNRIGLPAFLRTGCGSNKHDWKNSCYVTDASKLEQHVANIVEFCGMADLPTEVWVVREMLPTVPAFSAFYGQMPITKERRYFVNDGKVVCHHPYWPKESIKGQSPSVRHWWGLLQNLNKETAQERHFLSAQTRKVGKAVPGYWSVDWLWTTKGWYLTDMGSGEQSYHWPDCKFAL